MALPGTHTLNTNYLTCYTPSCGTTPVVAYARVPYRSRLLLFSGILGGAITTADGTITVTNVTQSTTVGTFTVTQSGSAAGQAFTGTPTTVTAAQCNEGDILALTPSAASGSSIPMHFTVTLRAN
jgi:hypothetical protein